MSAATHHCSSVSAPWMCLSFKHNLKHKKRVRLKPHALCFAPAFGEGHGVCLTEPTGYSHLLGVVGFEAPRKYDSRIPRDAIGVFELGKPIVPPPPQDLKTQPANHLRTIPIRTYGAYGLRPHLEHRKRDPAKTGCSFARTQKGHLKGAKKNSRPQNGRENLIRSIGFMPEGASSVSPCSWVVSQVVFSNASLASNIRAPAQQTQGLHLVLAKPGFPC